LKEDIIKKLFLIICLLSLQWGDIGNELIF